MKSPKIDDDWGEPGTDDVPLPCVAQTQWYLGVTGYDRWDLTAAIGRKICDYTLRRDDEFFGMLLEAAERFWRDHVLADRPPLPDGSKEFSAFLQRRYPESVAPILEATPAIARPRPNTPRRARIRMLLFACRSGSPKVRAATPPIWDAGTAVAFLSTECG